MINSITIENPIGETLSIELGSPEKSGFSVLGMSGIGSVKAFINSTDIQNYDGTIFNSARLGYRNIVMKLGFLEKPTIEETRQITYKYFPIKQLIKIIIETDTKTVQTYGRTESNEVDIFSKEESSTISLICDDPYFYELNSVITVFDGIYPSFTFPFSNESLVTKLIQFGYISDKTVRTIIYRGTAPTGFILSLKASGSVVDPVLNNAHTNESMTIKTSVISNLTGFGFQNGDEIVISTVKGNKYINLIRNGLTTNIITALDKNSDWLSLIQGANTISYSATSGVSSLSLTTTHNVLHEGI